MSAYCFHLMLLVIYCLWILIFISVKQIQQSIGGWGHVSPRTFAALLANPFIPAQVIHYTVRLINANMSCMHIWGWMLFRGQETDCVHVCECVCVYVSLCKGRVTVVEGEGLTLYFSFLAYQPWRASWCNKKPCISVTWPAECNCEPLGSKWKQCSAISQHAGLKRDHKNPPLPLARNVPALPQPALFTRSSSTSSWQGNSGCVCVYTEAGPTLVSADLSVLNYVALWSHKPIICPFKALEHTQKEKHNRGILSA